MSFSVCDSGDTSVICLYWDLYFDLPVQCIGRFHWMNTTSFFSLLTNKQSMGRHLKDCVICMLFLIRISLWIEHSLITFCQSESLPCLCSDNFTIPAISPFSSRTLSFCDTHRNSLLCYIIYLLLLIWTHDFLFVKKLFIIYCCSWLFCL